MKLEYRQKGKDYIIHCLNPKHEDNSPSMRVDAVTGVYHCFSCGYKGNLLTESGTVYSPASFKVTKLKQKIAKLMSPYLEIPKTASTQKLPWRGFSAELLQQFGAFIETNLYPDRIVFPVRDYTGNITAFIGRYMHSDAPPKYKVYPDSAEINIFPNKPEIYNSSIVIVEGITDFLNLYKNGVKNATAILGVGTLYKNWKERLTPLKAQGVNKIYICLDGDRAGRSAAEKLEKLISPDFAVEVIYLPEDKDPGALSKKEVNEYIVDKLL